MDLFAKMRWYWQFECFNYGVVIFSIYLIIVILILVENIETVRKTVCVNKCSNDLRKFPNESIVHCDVLARMFRNSVKKVYLYLNFKYGWYSVQEIEFDSEYDLSHFWALIVLLILLLYLLLCLIFINYFKNG